MKKIRWHEIATYQNGVENTYDAYDASDQVYIDAAHYNESSEVLMKVG